MTIERRSPTCHGEEDRNKRRTVHPCSISDTPVTPGPHDWIGGIVRLCVARALPPNGDPRSRREAREPVTSRRGKQRTLHPPPKPDDELARIVSLQASPDHRQPHPLRHGNPLGCRQGRDRAQRSGGCPAETLARSERQEAAERPVVLSRRHRRQRRRHIPMPDRTSRRTARPRQARRASPSHACTQIRLADIIPILDSFPPTPPPLPPSINANKPHPHAQQSFLLLLHGKGFSRALLEAAPSPGDPGRASGGRAVPAARASRRRTIRRPPHTGPRKRRGSPPAPVCPVPCGLSRPCPCSCARRQRRVSGSPRGVNGKRRVGDGRCLRPLWSYLFHPGDNAWPHHTIDPPDRSTDRFRIR